MSTPAKAPISAAAESFDNAPSPISPDDGKHDPSKESSLNIQGHEGVQELHARADTATEYQEFLNLHDRYYGTKEWSKVLRKMDFRILPPLAMSYLLCFLDRGNVGNAVVAGLRIDIPMSDAIYNTGLAAFFFLYILLEIPSQIALKKFGARWWISGMLVATGIVMSSASAIKSSTGFILFRLFLGLAECGVMPGINETISAWYTREELGRRVAIFFSSASLASAFSGILAYGITSLDGKRGLEGWRWLFLIEGIITCAFGCLGPLMIVGYPRQKYSWLSHDEQRYLILRQRYSTNGQVVPRNEGNSPGLVKEVASRWHIYFQMAIYFSHSALGYSITYTLAPIFRSLKFTKIESFLYPVPIYLGACVFTVVNCHFSDKRKRRAEHVAGPFLLCILGLAFTIGSRARSSLIGVTFTGLVFLVFGAYAATPPSLAWVGSNFIEPHKHIALGFQIAFGSLGGLTGSFIYLSAEAPKYNTGYSVSMVIASVASVCCLILKIGYDRENKKRDQVTKESIEQNYSEKELAGLGDKSPYFRYWS